MFGGIGIPELVLIFLALLLLFGAKRIPLIARGLGEGIRNFKGGLGERDRLPDPDRHDAERHDPPRSDAARSDSTRRDADPPAAERDREDWRNEPPGA